MLKNTIEDVVTVNNVITVQCAWPTYILTHFKLFTCIGWHFNEYGKKRRTNHSIETIILVDVIGHSPRSENWYTCLNVSHRCVLKHVSDACVLLMLMMMMLEATPMTRWRWPRITTTKSMTTATSFYTMSSFSSSSSTSYIWPITNVSHIFFPFCFSTYITCIGMFACLPAWCALVLHTSFHMGSFISH